MGVGRFSRKSFKTLRLILIKIGGLKIQNIQFVGFFPGLFHKAGKIYGLSIHENIQQVIFFTGFSEETNLEHSVYLCIGCSCALFLQFDIFIWDILLLRDKISVFSFIRLFPLYLSVFTEQPFKCSCTALEIVIPFTS